MKCLPKS